MFLCQLFELDIFLYQSFSGLKFHSGCTMHLNVNLHQLQLHFSATNLNSHYTQDVFSFLAETNYKFPLFVLRRRGVIKLITKYEQSRSLVVGGGSQSVACSESIVVRSRLRYVKHDLGWRSCWARRRRVLTSSLPTSSFLDLSPTCRVSSGGRRHAPFSHCTFACIPPAPPNARRSAPPL